MSDKKYEFTGETKIVFGVTLNRIRAVRAIGFIEAGAIGGWISSDANLSQASGNAWVYGNALVYDNAQVYGNARVYGATRVYGNALVYGNAQVSGDARVSGNARVSKPIVVATRSDGYTFTLTHQGKNAPRIAAGCRFFTMKEAREHWTRTRGGTPLGAETDSILDHFERMIAAGALK